MKSLTISIDPSSTATGVAIFRGKKLVSIDIIKGQTKTKTAPHERALLMARHVIAVVEQRVLQIEKNKERIRLSVVIEVPGGQNRPHARGLVTLGMSVGACCSLLLQWSETFKDSSFEMVLASEWTRLGGGRPKSKDMRAEIIVEKFKSWDFSGDRGHDMKDAVGLGAWKLGLLK